jgi:hypothetical protein
MEIFIMKKVKWLALLILPWITFGIYHLVAYARMSKNSNNIAESCGEKKIIGYIPAFFLGFVTCGALWIVWQVKYQKQQIAIANANGISPKPVKNAFVLFLIRFVPVFGQIVICNNYNRNVDAAIYAVEPDDDF